MGNKDNTVRHMLRPVGHIANGYVTKFGIPRQPHLANLSHSSIVCNEELSFWAATNIQKGDEIIVIWSFSHNAKDIERWSKTVRPPLLGGTKRYGVFATRSSFRPNGLALSCVRVVEINNEMIIFEGGDMVSGTPVYGVLPYKRPQFYVSDASEGWRREAVWQVMSNVVISRKSLETIPPDMRGEIFQILKQDPRPAYTKKQDAHRVFWIVYDKLCIWFTVCDSILRVVDVMTLNSDDRDFVRMCGHLPDRISKLY